LRIGKVAIDPGLSYEPEFSTHLGHRFRFFDLIQGGNLNIDQTEEVPAPLPSGFQRVGSFYQFSTDAVFGEVEVSFPYSESEIPVGAGENTLRIRRWNGTNWEGASSYAVDIDNNLVSGKFSSFSWFAVAPNRSPIADAGQDQTIYVDSLCTPDIAILDGTGSADADEDLLNYRWEIYGEVFSEEITDLSLPQGSLGSHEVLLAVEDGQGGIDSDTVNINVVDQFPPEMTVTIEPDVLWPPNHKMMPVSVTVTATDNCSSEPLCQITSIASNEQINEIGDGNTAPDWEITGILTANLRAERAGIGSDRIYTATVECTDDVGNSATAQATVTVPHDKGNGKKKK
jgi:hypothetical protein